MILIKRILIRCLTVLLALSFSFWLYLRWTSSLPSDVKLPGLLSTGDIAIDARGFATIEADNLADAFKIQGYYAASQRLFQMDIARRLAGGRLSEIFGRQTLNADKLHRLYGFQQIARAALELMDPEELKDLDAFADGVNSFIKQNPHKLGLEFLLLNYHPELWSAYDSILCLLFMNESQSNSWRDDIRRSSFEILGKKKIDFIFPVFTQQDILVIPDLNSGRDDASSLFKANLNSDHHQGPQDFIQHDDPTQEVSLFGSNSWVITGSKSHTGKPFLANDPHMDLAAPGYWLPLRIKIRSTNELIQGVALPFIPGILLGQNQTIAWGFTNLSADQQDLYSEPKTSERTEIIKMKSWIPQFFNKIFRTPQTNQETYQVPLGIHGPQIVPMHSLVWSALNPKFSGLPIRKIMLARNWKEFNNAFDQYRGPAMNVTYADSTGNVGWRAAGLIPIRPRPFLGTSPLPLGVLWSGYVPQDQMPRVLNPSEGWVISANQRTIGTKSPLYVSSRWASPARAQRIHELLLGQPLFGAKDFHRIQMDTVSIPHRDLIKKLLPYMSEKMRNMFSDWDGSSNKESTLFLEAEIIRSTIRDNLFSLLTSEKIITHNNDAPVLQAIIADQKGWTTAGLGDKEAFVKKSLRAAEDKILEKKKVWKTWGAFNAFRPSHPLGNSATVLRWLFNPWPQDLSGNSRAIRANQPQYGQSMRLIADLSDPNASSLVIPLGSSGHLASPYRINQREEWLAGASDMKMNRWGQPAVHHIKFH